MPQVINSGIDVKRPSKRKVSRCIEVVCQAYGCNRHELLLRIRSSRISRRRFVAFWLARCWLGMSYPEIGRRVGGFDHTTVLNGLRWVERQRAEDPGYFVLTEWLLTVVQMPPPVQEPVLIPSEEIKPPRPAPPPHKVARHDPWATGNTFYCCNPDDPRALRSFLEDQDKRFLAALERAGERP